VQILEHVFRDYLHDFCFLSFEKRKVMSVFLQASVYNQARLPAPQEVIANRLSCTRHFSSLYTGFGQFSTMSKTGSPSQDNIQREKGKNRISIAQITQILEDLRMQHSLF
jgi:hypothetical protein